MTGRPVVLVIDDDDDMRHIAMMTLERVDPEGRLEHLDRDMGQPGIDLIERLAKEGRPVLVFCDYRMPRMDGVQVAEAVQRYRDQIPIRFVLLSSLGALADESEAAAHGVDQVVEKGFTPQEWRGQFQRLLDAWLAELGDLASP